jgi:pilus assembly protein Flp/PilA
MKSTVLLTHRLKRSRGQALVEYALVIALVAVVAVSVLMATGTNVSGTFNTVETQLDNASQGGTVAVPPGGGAHH